MTRRNQRISFSLMVGAIFLCVSCSTIPTKNSQRGNEYPYDSLIFDIAAVESCQPNPATLDFVKTQLEQLGICKSSNVIFRERTVNPYFANYGIWHISNIYAFRNRFSSVPEVAGPGRRYFFVGYVQGLVFDSKRVGLIAGLQFGNNDILVFKNGAYGIESSVLLHEVLHAIGLRKTNKVPLAHCPQLICLMFPILYKEKQMLCADCKKELDEIVCRLRSKRQEVKLY